MRPDGVEAGVERSVGGQHALDGHCSDEIGGLHELASTHEDTRAECGHRRRALDERDALRGGEGQGLEPCGAQSGFSLSALAVGTWTQPSPIKRSARWARGARSPEAPTLPWLGIQG